MMNEGTLAQTIFSLLMLSIFAGLFIWGVWSGQFQGVEEAKYVVLAPDEEEVSDPWQD